MGWRTHVNPWLIQVSVWQKPLQYCKVISLQLIKINEKKKKKRMSFYFTNHYVLSYLLVTITLFIMVIYLFKFLHQ